MLQSAQSKRSLLLKMTIFTADPKKKVFEYVFEVQSKSKLLFLHNNVIVGSN